jgi:hypothetical protein
MQAEEKGRRAAIVELRGWLMNELDTIYLNLRDEVQYFGPKGNGTSRAHGRYTQGRLQSAIKHFESIIPAAFSMDNMQDLVQEKVRKRQVRGARNRIEKLKRLLFRITDVLMKTDPLDPPCGGR